uniref:SFRICE_026935 n=1 Tax=Spodoptera frugiperda TaxID=7108 RepID=A0A2H1VLN9_SPOFR
MYRTTNKSFETFDLFINPFDAEIPKDILINISSGKAASEPVKKFLLNIEKSGDVKHKTFMQSAKQILTDLKRALKNTIRKIYFGLFKKRKTKVGGKVQEVRIQRLIWARYGQNFVISHNPLSMCHFDSGICKSQKSTLMKSLEKDVEHNPSSQIDTLYIDGFFFVTHDEKFP